jgi:hypothetical protein
MFAPVVFLRAGENLRQALNAADTMKYQGQTAPAAEIRRDEAWVVALTGAFTGIKSRVVTFI